MKIVKILLFSENDAVKNEVTLSDVLASLTQEPTTRPMYQQNHQHVPRISGNHLFNILVFFTNGLKIVFPERMRYQQLPQVSTVYTVRIKMISRLITMIMKRTMITE